MRAMVSFGGRYYAAEQDRRGRADEADLVVYKGAAEILRRSIKKCETVDELRMATVKALEKLKEEF